MENNDKSTIVVYNSLSESDVGITEFLNKNNKGFACIIKHRYSDFIVNEIDTNGNVVWLKSTDKVENVKSNVIVEESNNEETPLNEDLISSILKKDFSNILNEDDLVKFEKYLLKFVTKEICNDERLKLSYIDDKLKRTVFHEKIKNNFRFLDSTTDGQGERKIEIFLQTNKRGYNKRRKVFADEKNYLTFSLMKRNLDTISAINYIARFLKRSSKCFKFAGNKDKRGITTQRISLYKGYPDEIINAQKSRFWDNKIEIANYVYSDKGKLNSYLEIRLGLLKGNQFSVVLRFIECEDSIIEDSIKFIKENGFINYFGMQRFGNSIVPTHIIGLQVLKKQWKDVMLNVLNFQLEESRKKLNLSNHEDVLDMKYIDKVIDSIPHKNIMEKKILICIKKSNYSYFNAFNVINKQLQVLYPHAYQSYIFNLSVSERLKKFGMKILIGDIVKKKKSLEINDINPEIIDDLEGIPEQEDQDDNDKDKEKELFEDNNHKDLETIFQENYELVTEENINNYTIYDVVMPVVGYKVKFPENEIKTIIMDLMTKDNITLDNFKNSSLFYYAVGYYRKILERTFNVKYDILKFDSQDADLQVANYNVEQHSCPKAGKNKALRLQFSLPQATYATMLFRELTKQSSAVNFQSQLSESKKNN